MYSAYDQQASRSPGSHRNPQQNSTLHRMPSRQFDAYAPLPQYGQEDHARSYEQPRNYDRLNATVHGGGYGYDMGAPAGWNTNAFAQNGMGSLGGAAAARMKSQQRGGGGGRSALPSVSSPSTPSTPSTAPHMQRHASTDVVMQGWMDQSPQGLPTFALPSMNNGNGSMLNPSYGQDVDEELIPTAIVIKNIPFAVKKEQLVSLMTDLRLPPALCLQLPFRQRRVPRPGLRKLHHRRGDGLGHRCDEPLRAERAEAPRRVQEDAAAGGTRAH